MFTEYTVLEKTLGNMSGRPANTIFKYHHFKSACYSYINLLDIDMSAGFCCDSCGKDPSLLVMDATSLSFRKALVSWKMALAKTSSTPKAGR